MGIKRDKLGYITLENYDIEGLDSLDSKDIFSFIFNDNKYYFKKVKSVKQSYNELIGYELAKDFGIDAIEYDLASFHGHIGFISKDFSNSNYHFLEEYLVNYYGDYKGRNNLYDISIMFMNILPDDKMNTLLDDFRRLLMFDIIIANSDRHDRNIIIDSSNMRIGPVFDNEMLCNEDCYFSFSLTGRDDNTISSFLSVLSSDELDFFEKKVNIISRDNLEKIFKRIEDKIGTQIVEYIKNSLLEKYDSYYNYLLKVLKYIRGNKLELKID